MGLAKEMWDYLKSIGFEDIPNDDYRLGVHAGSWKNTIRYGNLCAYNDRMDDFTGFVDTTKKFNQNNPDLKIRSVADLEAWLRKEYPEFFTVEQHQYKVGDKVRILEDATNDNGDSVLEIYERTKTAVGEIGIVNQKFENGLILVGGLPQKCGGWWTYEPHQIEPYIEESSTESSNESDHYYIGILPEKVANGESSSSTTKSTTPEDSPMQAAINKDNIEAVLEYNGIDKELYHFVDGGSINTPYAQIRLSSPTLVKLLEIEFNQELKPLPEPNPFDVVKVGQWVRCILPSHKYVTYGKWYQHLRKDEQGYLIYIDNCGRELWSYESFRWDLTDIRDYNPDEEIVLKIGDILDIHGDGKHQLTEINYDYEDIRCGDIVIIFDGLSTIKSVNGKQGKFKIPEFDFVQTLIDAGFKEDDHGYISNNFSHVCSCIWFNADYSQTPTREDLRA
jgi:hypothetical protein